MRLSGDKQAHETILPSRSGRGGNQRKGGYSFNGGKHNLGKVAIVLIPQHNNGIINKAGGVVGEHGGGEGGGVGG